MSGVIIIGWSPGGSGYFTCKQNIKLVSDMKLTNFVICGTCYGKKNQTDSVGETYRTHGTIEICMKYCDLQASQ